MMLTGLYAFSQRSHKNKRSLAQSWLKIGDSPVVLHKLQINPVGFTNPVVYTITRCHLGFWISNKTREWWSLPWLQRSAMLRKTSLPFCLQSSQLWPWSQKLHKSKPLTVHVTIVKQWIAPCTWDVRSIKMQFSRSLFLKTRESASHQFHRSE